MDRKLLIDECKKYLGMEPFNDPTNIVVGDYYYLQSLYNKYGVQEVERAILKLRNVK
jgi:hypothetical protein